jgi:apolipoprotein N-acyltransferase
VLVVQTNNATFGRTSETYQQLAMSQLRALEHGRTVLQVATTGASAVINSNGDIVSESKALYEPAILTTSVQPITGLTLADRVQAWPEYVLSALALLALGFAIRAGRRRAPQPEPAAARVDEANTANTEEMVQG